jgi:hypothetical protein
MLAHLLRGAPVILQNIVHNILEFNDIIPLTTAMVFVRGRTRRILSKAAGKSCATATTVSYAVSFSY